SCLKLNRFEAAFVDFNHVDLVQFFSNVKLLRTLILTECKNVSEDALISATVHCTLLETVLIERMPISVCAFLMFLHCCPFITTLTVCHLPYVPLIPFMNATVLSLRSSNNNTIEI